MFYCQLVFDITRRCSDSNGCCLCSKCMLHIINKKDVVFCIFCIQLSLPYKRLTSNVILPIHIQKQIFWRFKKVNWLETNDSLLSVDMFPCEWKRTRCYSCEVFALILECRAGIFSRKAWKHLFAHAVASVCNWARDSADNLDISEYGTRSCCKNMLVKL